MVRKLLLIALFSAVILSACGDVGHHDHHDAESDHEHLGDHHDHQALQTEAFYGDEADSDAQENTQATHDNVKEPQNHHSHDNNDRNHDHHH